MNHSGKMNPAYKHGHATKKYGHSSTYMSWYSMIRRCNNNKTAYYKHYGGRGIKVYSPWIKSFVMFLEYVGEKPKGMTLDRINNNKGYYPGNVKWSTRKEQARNRRRNLMGKDYIINGKKYKAFEIQEIFKIKRSTIYARIKYGLPIVLPKDLT